MKQLLAGIVIILVIGIAGFMYRYIMEHPKNGGAQIACTQEAKVCPDGTSVGRTGPNCAFAACALPNTEDIELGIAFVIPAGYVTNPDVIGAEPTLSAVFEKPVSGSTTDSILIRRYAIENGQTATSTILAHTTYETSGITAKSLKEFSPVIINGKTFYSVVLERFEGQVHSAYYLPRATDVLRFEVIEKGVDWTNPKLVIADLPEHRALLQLLATLQP